MHLHMIAHMQMIDKKVIVGEPQNSDPMKGKLVVRREVNTDCT